MYVSKDVPQYLVHFGYLNLDGVWTSLTEVDWTLNYGDVLVSLSILRQLGSSNNIESINFGERANKSPSTALIRGSTYLHNEFDFEKANASIDSINGPVTIVGLGAQSPESDYKFLDNNEKAKSFVARLNEKSQSISARGAFSAQVLERLGAKSIRITGCPSLFYSGKCPEVKVGEMLTSEYRRLGISLHTGLGNNIFCRNYKETMAAHSELLDFAYQNSSQTSLFEQGVRYEFTASDPYYPYDVRLNAAKLIATKIGSSQSAERILASMVSLHSTQEWLSKARDLDAILGFRFHGNMVALLQGIPCYYYVYDSRITEFCELYKLPYTEVEQRPLEPIKEIIDHDWSVTNNAFSKCYDEMIAFYNENNISHILK